MHHQKNEQRLKKILLVAGGLAIVIIMYVLFIKMKNLSIQALISSVGFKNLIIAFSLLLCSELVRAARLTIILRSIGVKVTLKTTLIARLVGDTAGLLSPSNIAAEPARVLTLASIHGLPLEVFGAAGLLESLYDFMSISIIALIAASLFIPASIPVLVVDIVLILLWAAGLLGLVYKESVWRRIVCRLTKKLSPRIQEIIVERYRLFTRFIKENTNIKLHTISVALTILSLLLISASFIPLEKSSCTEGFLYRRSLNRLILYLVAYSMGSIMSALPTPGGSGFFEYGLSVSLPPSIVASWRMVFILFSIVPTLLILLFMARLRSRILRNLEKSLFHMLEENNNNQLFLMRNKKNVVKLFN